MGKIIYKYPISAVTQLQEIEVPKGAEILDIQLQRESDHHAVMWVESEIGEKEKMVINLQTCVTGMAYNRAENSKYVKTVILQGGDYVVHYFQFWV